MNLAGVSARRRRDIRKRGEGAIYQLLNGAGQTMLVHARVSQLWHAHSEAIGE